MGITKSTYLHQDFLKEGTATVGIRVREYQDDDRFFNEDIYCEVEDGIVYFKTKRVEISETGSPTEVYEEDLTETMTVEDFIGYYCNNDNYHVRIG